MEQNAVYDKFVIANNWWEASNQTVRGYKLTAFACPSDIDAPIHNTAQDFGYRGNYVANAGIGTYKRVGDPTQQTGLTVKGPFVHGMKARIADVTDGTSNTAAVSEIRKSPDNDSRGALFADAGSVQYTHDFLPNEDVSDITERCVSGTKTPCSSGGPGGPHRLTAKSYHTGGVNLLLFDGSVRFVTNGVDQPAWQATASMNGNEAIGLP